jgi:hypothetical protein
VEFPQLKGSKEEALALKYTQGEFTGIYREVGVSADDPKSMKEFCLRANIDIETELSRIEEVASKIFSENCTLPDWYSSLPELASPIAKNAREVLFQVKGYRDFRKYNDNENAVLCAFLAGRFYERLLVRAFEPLTMKGYEAIENERRGQERVHGTKYEKEQEWAKWQKVVNDEFSENPHLSHRSLAHIASLKFGISSSTVRRRTYHPGRGTK